MAENRKRRFTKLEIDRLTAMWADNVPIPVMAQRLHRSPGVISQRVRRMRLAGAALPPRTQGNRPHRWRPQDDEIIRGLWPTEIRVNEIAERLHRHPSAISIRAHAMGLPRKPHPKVSYTASIRIRAMGLLLEHNYSKSDIAIVMGTPVESIRAVCQAS